MTRSWITAFLAILVLVLTGCSPGDSSTASTIDPVPAPDFATGVQWLNVPSAPTIPQLEGKVTIIYFWTTSCLSCRSVVDDAERLENEFPEAVVPIGIHTGRFEAESDPSMIGRFLTRWGLDHAIANDADYRIWQDWGITSWPTTVVVSHDGMVAARHSGDDAYEALMPVVESLVENPPAPSNPSRVVFTNQPEAAPQTVLSFPGDVLADPAGGRLFISDTGHHRIVVADIETDDVLDVIGSGQEGFADGDAGEANFTEPGGLALSEDGSVLYVADTSNHAIREVDLATGEVETIAGTGERGRPRTGKSLDSPLDHPWDVELIDGDLLVSVAGSNQIWRIDLDRMELEEEAGTGRAGVDNGPKKEARLAQPSGLARNAGGLLVVADAGSSSVRLLDETELTALTGPVDDLFDFGETDGSAAAARFQYPLGVTTTDGMVWVADTFNHRIRGIDSSSRRVTTLAGSQAGWRDGMNPLFSSPAGIDAAVDTLYVADRGNHSIRRVDPATGQAETVVLKGIELLVSNTDDAYEGAEITLDAVQVTPGPGAIVLDVAMPVGYKINPLAPSRFEWSSSGIATIDPLASQSITGPSFPMEVVTSFSEGEGMLRADLWLVYCEADQESICLFDRTRINVPVDVTPDATSANVSIDYEIIPPELASN